MFVPDLQSSLYCLNNHNWNLLTIMHSGMEGVSMLNLLLEAFFLTYSIGDAFCNTTQLMMMMVMMMFHSVIGFVCVCVSV